MSSELVKKVRQQTRGFINRLDISGVVLENLLDSESLFLDILMSKSPKDLDEWLLKYTSQELAKCPYDFPIKREEVYLIFSD